MQFSYMAALLFSLTGMVVLDHKYALAFWHDPRRTAKVLAICLTIFIIWDILGIALGIFFSGHSAFMSGIYLAPDFPIEELLFLTFLCYFTLITYLLLDKQWRRM